MKFTKIKKIFITTCLLFTINGFCQSTSGNKYVPCDTSKINTKFKFYEQRIEQLTKNRDSLQLLYDESLVHLDSLVGFNSSLVQELTNKQIEILKAKNMIDDIMVSKNISAKTMADARELIYGLNNKVSDLEAEVIRLNKKIKSLEPKSKQ